jgi:transcriptional regulator with XRE-family HTH domain
MTRTCDICGEPIEEERRSQAKLCRLCASGKRPRTCQRCGKTFRGVTAKWCKQCRREMARKRALGKGKKRPETPLKGVEQVLSLGDFDLLGITTHEDVKELRERLSLSQAQFAQMLGRWRDQPYSRSYVSKLERGLLPITDEVRRALGALQHSTEHLQVMPVRVYAVEELPAGTVILGQPKICPTCKGIFIYPWANQVYCSKECKRVARNRRRRKRRQQNGVSPSSGAESTAVMRICGTNRIACRAGATGRPPVLKTRRT